MIDSQNFRKTRIKVYDVTGDLLATYEDKIYIYYDHKIKDGCFHFETQDGLHHRIYEGIVLVDEI